MEEKDNTQVQEQKEEQQDSSFVDMLDGEGHSQDDDIPDFHDSLPEEAPASAPEEKADSAQADEDGEIERLNGLLERVKKRLHDTQARLHEECTRRAEIQKELSDFQKREDDPDDWFSDDDKKRQKELQQQIAESDERLRQIDESSTAQTDEVREEWLAAADKAAKAHPDFAQKVYTELGGLIDPQGKGYNPAVRQAWDALADKSPESAYKFATDMLERIEAVKDPAAYKEKVRQEILATRGNQVPTGAAGFDMVNSARGDSPEPAETDGFVEALFK